VFPIGTNSGTATCAVPKPELPTYTFSCRIYAGIAIVWGGGSGTGRHRPHMCKCRPQTGLQVMWTGTMRQRTSITTYGYGSARLRHGTHDVWFRALFKPMAHEIQARGALHKRVSCATWDPATYVFKLLNSNVLIHVDPIKQRPIRFVGFEFLPNLGLLERA
jgi:hypothetical protein